ncbi:MAG: isoprenylcysteine carboxylmethyltransferase family protein [Bacteroidales bacterium]|jgi:protein-S-isoprenylcysteine O-methyltransferase Ste14|nr:isoprenylcysteine carboxylmethyltransferase family protein [Bacteroidales bacterium]
MALINSFEKNGNILFKYRGQIPLFIFILGLPFLYVSYYTDYYAVFYAGLSQKFWTAIAVSSILISLLGVMVRAYTIGTTPGGTSGRNTQKQIAEELNVSGIYSVVRHPLYLGNYLMWAGLLVFMANVPLFIIASLIFWLYYERIMFAEERFLEKQFGEKYLQWSMLVPAIVPSLRKFKKGNIPFSFKSVLRREYSGVFAIILCFTLVDYLRYAASVYQENIPNPSWIRISLICTPAMFLIMIILRTLKHHTSLLNSDENRD